MRFILTLFTFCTICVHGQNFEIPVEYFVNNQLNQLDNTNYSGSPYLYDNFKSATIFFKNKNYSVNIRLNIYKQQFEILQNDKISRLNFNQGMNVNFDGLSFVPLQIGSKIVPVVMLISGKHTLYKYFVAKYTPEKPAKSSYDKPRLANFKVTSRYAIKFLNKNIEHFDLGRKISSVLFKQNNDVLDFIKKNKLKFRKESELIDVVNYLNK